jgi:hypothetical protein
VSSIDADSNKEPYYIFTDEEADQLITEALDTDLSDPEPLVELLLIIYDHIHEARLKDSIYLLMKVAFKYSIVHSVNFQEYLEAIRRDQNPAQEARARRYGGHNSEA